MEKNLVLDRDLLDRSATFNEGYARVLEQEPSQDNLLDERAMVRASSLVVAAVYRALIGDVSPATILFQEAAEEYQKLDRPFHLALAICGGYKRLTSDQVLRRVRADPSFDPHLLDPETLLYDLLAAMSEVGSQAVDDYHFDSEFHNESARMLALLFERGDELLPLPVGRLGIPLRLYISIGRKIHGLTVSRDINVAADFADGELISLKGALTEYLQRVDEVVGGAMNDEFHWTRLRSGVLPIEPEALATCLSVDAVSRRRTDQHVISLVDDTDLTARQKLPAQAATEMARWQQ
jgi:hypothetical protein